MIKVQALDSFEHSGRRARGDCFEVSEKVAAALVRKGLVRVVGGEFVKGPQRAGGAPSSASPAAQASPQTTAKPSVAGAKKRGRKKKTTLEASS